MAEYRGVDYVRGHRYLGFRIKTAHRLDCKTVATLRYSRMRRNYDEFDALDGPLTSVTAGFNRVLMPTLRVDVSPGWSRERPASENSHSAGWQIGGGLFALLPKGYTVGGDVS